MRSLRVSPVSRTVRPAAVLLALLLAGCLEGRPDDVPLAAGSRIEPVQGGDGASAGLVSNATGAIVGRAIDGFDAPVWDAHASLFGTDHTTTTNETGDLAFPHLPPGRYYLRVDHPDYRAAESQVEVTAGNLSVVRVVLLLRADSSAAKRPHAHDYWGDNQRVTVLDGPVAYHPTSAGGFNGALQPLTGPANHAWTGDCLSGSENPSPATGPFRFAEPNQLVWPGTQAMEIRLDWTPRDYAGEKMSVIWHPANTREYSRGLLTPKGQPIVIPVGPGEADLGHQLYTSWEFALCTSEKGETISYGRPASGNVHVTMELVRGPEIPREPAHPDYWADGSRITVINETKVFDGGEAAAWLLSSRGGRADFRFEPETGVIVPAGTTQIEARLSWAYEGMVELPPLSLSYTSSTVAPWEKWMMEKREVPEPLETGPGVRRYRFAVDETAADAVYQTISNWAFYWNFEGEERQDYALHPCLCRLVVQLDVVAVGPQES